MQKLSDVARVIDCLHVTPSYTEKGFPVARVEDVNNNFFEFDSCLKVSEQTVDFHNRNHVPKKGDILITRVGSYGRMALIDEDRKMCVGQNVSIISPYKDSEFLYYYLKSPYAQKFIHGNSNGSSYKSLSLEQIKNIPFNIKGLDITRIANLLYKIDKKIDFNNKINNDLDNILKLTYERWFIQFDFPNDNNKPYKLNDGIMIYDEYLKRNIPIGWSSSNIFESPITSIIQPGINHFDRKNYLATANVVNSTIIDGDWISYDGRENRANMQPIKNSLWFAKMKNSVKHISITEDDQWIIDKYIFSTGFCGVSSNSNAFGYMHCFINSKHFEEIKNRLSHGATQEGVNNDDLKSIKLIIPPEKILTMFNQIALPLIKMRNNNYQQNQNLMTLKEFILPLLMNGQMVLKQ